MRYGDSITKRFQEYSTPGARIQSATAPPGKFEDFQDPTYLGFYVKFHGIDHRPIGDVANYVPLDEFPGGLLYHEDHPDSAIRYLKNIGEYTRAQMLREFIAGIKSLSENTPWFFTKVSGLDTIWQINPAESFRGKEKKLTFELLESIDLKITYLMDLYRKAVFDTVYMRYMLPSNLRLFEMELVITEIRTMHRPEGRTALPKEVEYSFTGRGISSTTESITEQLGLAGAAEQATEQAAGVAANAIIPAGPLQAQAASILTGAISSSINRDYSGYAAYPTKMANFDNLATFLTFSFAHCEFLPWDNAPAYLSSVTKTPETMATGGMVISTPVIREFNTYGLMGAILNDTLFTTDRTKAKAEKDFPAGVGDNAKNGSLNQSEQGYLAGIKNESFNDTQQFRNQKAIRKANRVGVVDSAAGGFLGAATDTLINVATNALFGAAKDAIGKVLLGSFGPETSGEIATKVALDSPEFIQNVLTNVVLLANGAEIEGAPQPAKIDLDSPPTKNIENANVTLVSPTMQPLSSTQVILDSPPAGTNTPGDVLLEGTNPGPILSGRVDFESTGASLSGGGGKAELEGAPSLIEGLTGKTELDGGEAALVGSTGKTELVATPAASEGTLQTILVAPPVSDTGAGSVELIAPLLSENESSSVELLGAQPDVAKGGQVELTSPEVSPGQTGVVDLIEPQKGDGSAGQVELQGIGGIDGSGGSVELVAPQINESGPSLTTLSAPPKPIAEETQVSLEAPPSTVVAPAQVDLLEAPGSRSNISQVDLQEPSKSVATGGKITLDGPTASNVDPGSVTLDGITAEAASVQSVTFTEPPTTEQREIRKVDFVEPPQTVVVIEPIKLEAAPLQNPVLQPEPLTGAPSDLTGETGKVDLQTPAKKNVNLPDTKLESPPAEDPKGRIGKANL